jgi:hypothetical protein
MRSTINNPHLARQGGEKGMRDVRLFFLWLHCLMSCSWPTVLMIFGCHPFGTTQALFATKPKAGSPSTSAPPPPQTNQRLIESEQRQQMQLLQNQDKEIEAVASTVVNLKEIAVVMGNELDEQSRCVFCCVERGN